MPRRSAARFRSWPVPAQRICRAGPNRPPRRPRGPARRAADSRDKYDGNGNLIERDFPDGTKETWTFDPTWNEPTVYVDPAGHETDYTLDANNGDVLTVTAGALYPALHRLEARGLISAVWRPSDNNRRAKFYGLTARGRKQLDSQRKQWERFSDAVALVLRDA